jgi:hypothetical protein
MPCEEIIIRISPSAKTRLKKTCFLRENSASPRRAFFDSKKTTENTPIDLVEKLAPSAKNAGEMQSGILK